MINITPEEDNLGKEKPEKSSIINIQFSETKNGNFKLQSDNDMFAENYYREPMNLFDGNEFDVFITGCESAIRTSESYSAYIAYLKEEIGLTRDAFNSEISQDNAKLEMHHGPIFTLYDYVKIIIDYFFDNEMPVSTFTVAKQVMFEHFSNRIQVVMLTKNNHNLVHAGKLCLDFRQCHGSLKDFITIYHKYIERSPKLKNKILSYKRLLDANAIHNTDILRIESLIDWSPKKK